MDLRLDWRIAAGYHGSTQAARVVIEDWVSRSVVCVECGTGSLDPTPENTRASDFRCTECEASFELKSRRGPIGGRVVDGDYDSMTSALASDTAPNLLLLRYDVVPGSVRDLFAVRHGILTPLALEKRPPLSEKARRSGWVGCNINLDLLPDGALVPIVRRGVARPLKAVRWEWSRFDGLSGLDPGRRGWLADVLSSVQRLPGRAFTLPQVYLFERELAALHPENRHVRPKIRQQLQELVKLGLIQRASPGLYIRR
jgi:type II restriction enzyme